MELIKKEPACLSKAERELNTEAISRLFRKFAIPSVIGLLFLGLQTIIDGIVLGNYVGANALASVSLVLPSYTFMIAVAVVVGVGCQTIVSIRLGQQDRKGASDALTSAFLFLTTFAALISLVLYIFSPSIVVWLGANEVLQTDAVSYIRALVPFFPILSGMFLGDYMLKAMGKPLYSMVIMSSTVILNIILDIVFVIVLGWGAAGAGLATGLAFSLGAMCSIPFIFRKKSIVSVLKGRFKLRLVGEMIYNGSSEGMSELSSGISVMLLNFTMMKYLGESGVAAFSAIQYVFFIGITVFLGISDGIIPVVSYNYGANRWDRIRQVLLLAVKTNLTIGIVLFLSLTLFGGQIISLFFKNGESEVIRIAAHGTAIYAFAFLLNGLNILASSYFTALANAKISVIISLLRGLVFVVIGIVVFPMMLGIDGVWLAVPTAELCTFIVSFILVRRSLKQSRLEQPVLI